MKGGTEVKEYSKPEITHEEEIEFETTISGGCGW